MSEAMKAQQAFDAGRSHLDAGNYSEAMKHFMQASLLRPNQAEYHAWLALVFNNQGNYSSAAEAANKALQLDPRCALAYRQIAYVHYMDTQDYPAALQDYSRAIELDSSDSRAYYWRGRTYYVIGDDSRAVNDLTQAIQLDDTYATAYYWLGKAYYATDSLEQAISSYSQAIRLMPNNRFAYLDRGDCYYRLKQFSKAIQDFSKAIELDPKEADGYRLRAEVSTIERNFSSAVEDYSRAILLDPNDAGQYVGRGLAFQMQQEHESAIEDFSKAIQLDSQMGPAYGLRGDSFLVTENFLKASQDYSQALAMDPENLHALVNRGLSYAAQGDYQKAYSDLSKAIEIDPENEDALHIRADIALEQNDPSRAIEDYSRILQLNPNNAEVQKALAIAKKIASGDNSMVPHISDESVNLFNQAHTLLQSAGQEPNPQVARNAISYLSMAIEKAGAPFPRAHALKAMLFLEDLSDYDSAWKEAEKALRENPNEYRAQSVKTRIAGGSVQIAETGWVGGFLKAITSGSARDSFQTTYDISAAKASQRRFKNEVERLLEIFQTLCSEPLDATEYLYYVDDLVSLADQVIELQIPLDKKVNIYGCVANTPTEHLIFESEEQKREVDNVKLLVQGRVSMFR